MELIEDRPRSLFSQLVSVFQPYATVLTKPICISLFLVDDSGRPRPAVIDNNGFDLTREEAYFVIAAAALRRGYNVLAFDGPGQGAALREGRMVFRPDWEAVIIPVLDYAETRADFAKDKLALFGYSLGAFLVPRAAAFDQRPAAIILDDGMYDFFASNCSLTPAFLVEWINGGNDQAFSAVAGLLMKQSTNVRWRFGSGPAVDPTNWGSKDAAVYDRDTVGNARYLPEGKPCR